MTNTMHPQRRLRIVGKLDDIRGYMITVYDADTGETIKHIYRIVITLDVNQRNTAQVSYHESAPDSKLLLAGDDGAPIKNTVTIENGDIDVTAIEEIGD